jgi:MFS family permease
VRLRDDPDFRRYWLSRQISVAGSLTTAVALPVLVYRLSGSPSLTALTTVMEALPYLAFGLFAGALSDRWNRRRVMVAADLLNAVVLASVPVAWWLGVLTIPHAIIVGFVSQGVFAFFDGANFGALPTLVGRSRVGEANAAIWGFGGVLDLLVPLSVGAALAVIHPADLLVVDALSYVGSALLVLAIGRPLSRERGSMPPFRPRVILAEVVEGLRWLWRHDGVRGNTVIGTLQSAAGAGFMALFVPWADRLLHIGSSGWRFGVVFSVWGIGGIIAASVTPWLLRRMPTLRIVLLAIPLSALVGIATVLAPSWGLAALGLTFWGIFYQLVVVNSISYRMQVTPDELQGRVNTAGRVLSWGVGWSLGAAVAGLLEPVVGLRWAMLGLVLLCAVAAAYAWVSPLRTHVDDPVLAD